jgi:hypothetical protein
MDSAFSEISPNGECLNRKVLTINKIALSPAKLNRAQHKHFMFWLEYHLKARLTCG